MSWQSKGTQGCNAYSRAGLPCLWNMGEIPPSLLKVMPQCLWAGGEKSVSVEPQLAQKLKLKRSSIQPLGEFCCISHSLWNKPLENNMPLSPLSNPTVLQLFPYGFIPLQQQGWFSRGSIYPSIHSHIETPKIMRFVVKSLKFTSQGS